VTVVPGSPEDWMRRARSDLSLARTSPEVGVLLEDLCFHAQQAAEKALKAVLISRSVPAPRTHSITRLLELMPAADPLPQAIQAAAVLTDYAVVTRYPGAYEPVESEEYLEAVALAEAVVLWAGSEVGGQGAGAGRLEATAQANARESPDVGEVASSNGSEAEAEAME
jgi:HEPN domain-containing protein